MLLLAGTIVGFVSAGLGLFRIVKDLEARAEAEKRSAQKRKPE